LETAPFMARRTSFTMWLVMSYFLYSFLYCHFLQFLLR